MVHCKRNWRMTNYWGREIIMMCVYYPQKNCHNLLTLHWYKHHHHFDVSSNESGIASSQGYKQHCQRFNMTVVQFEHNLIGSNSHDRYSDYRGRVGWNKMKRSCISLIIIITLAFISLFKLKFTNPTTVELNIDSND